MKIGGLQKVSLIDYPGMICAVIFTQGCNFKCGYCHNPELVNPHFYTECLLEQEVFSFLEKRRGNLEAVTITGGEPTIQRDLDLFIKRVRDLGYFIKIDTNGSHPEILYRLISDKMIDYIAMDIKGPLNKYESIAGITVDEDKIKQSIKLIISSGVLYEFRTTVLKSLLESSDMLKIGALIRNARLYCLQRFIPSKTLDEKFIFGDNYSFEELEDMRTILSACIERVSLR
jgi:pyruvate formate lyase activating enzyme